MDAVAFAATVHADDRRKGHDVPYLTHLLAVASLVLEDGGDEDAAVGALLHDVVEDHGVEHLEEIEARFGTSVREVVSGCSDSFDVDGAEKQPWEVRKRAYVAHLRDGGVDRRTLLVSCADKLHNARSLVADLRLEGVGALGRFNAEPSQILWYYDALAGIFEDRLPTARNPRLLRVEVEELRSLIDAEVRASA